MKDIKNKHDGLNEIISTENNNFNEKNKGIILKFIKLHNCLDLIIKLNNRF